MFNLKGFSLFLLLKVIRATLGPQRDRVFEKAKLFTFIYLLFLYKTMEKSIAGLFLEYVNEWSRFYAEKCRDGPRQSKHI